MSPIQPITDNHGRPVNYLRLAVTDRCNLRCYYCMPAEGVQYLERKELLSYEEMERLVSVLSHMGVNKLRITGGEPFLRKDLIHFLTNIRNNNRIEKISITTNGILTARYLDELKSLGINDINLSLDTLSKERFYQITRRDEFEKVMNTYHQMLKDDFAIKINMVVMKGWNGKEIVPMAKLAKDHPVEVRYIEEMPFNGSGTDHPKIYWNYQRILKRLTDEFPDLQKVENTPHSTSQLYQVPGFAGKIGIIPAYSRTFCGSCNRIRLTAQGQLKTCLYDHGRIDIKSLIRNGISDEELMVVFRDAFTSRAKDGFEAEKRRPGKVSESMSTIGG